jgi:hypothetical protein
MIVISSLLFPAFPTSDFMLVLPRIRYGNMVLIVLSYFHEYKKKEIHNYLRIIGINGMFLNVATFSVTKRSISSTKTRKNRMLELSADNEP